VGAVFGCILTLLQIDVHRFDGVPKQFASPLSQMKRERTQLRGDIVSGRHGEDPQNLMLYLTGGN
jgi:hypothetical protein